MVGDILRRGGTLALLLYSLGSLGCVEFYDRAVSASLGYRSPIGLRVDLARIGTSILPPVLQELEVGESNLEDALAALGSPDRLHRTKTEEILEYYYRFARGTNLVVRPLFFLPYGSFASYRFDGTEQGPDAVILVFDHQGRLKRKAFRQSTPEDSFGSAAEGALVP